MNISRILKILTLSFGLALASRYLLISIGNLRQNSLTTELCSLVLLPLETGAMRDTHEGLQKALQSRGEVGACVIVTDNGRSFSPDCVQPQLNYHTTLCKAQGNAGMRAAIYFEQRNLFSIGLIWLWIILSLFIFAGLVLAKTTIKFLVMAYSSEVKSLFYGDEVTAKSTPTHSWVTQWASLTLTKLGISELLSSQASLFKRQFRDFEQQIQKEAIDKHRLTQEKQNSADYIEKVKRVRHDIRSSLSSLQSIHEKLRATNATTTKSLATAIHRIQTLMDELSQIDKEHADPRLVVAEVIAEEVVLVMTEKFQDTKSAKLKLHYDTKDLSAIMVAEKDFHSILENLLENALEAIAVGGSVALTIAKQNGHCEICIEDDGCGVPANVLPMLFTRGGTFGKANGSGHGLYNSKKSIASWGGKIECEPLIKGTRFKISLPLIQTGVVFVGLPDIGVQLRVIDDDDAVPMALGQAGYDIMEVATTYQQGQAVLACGLNDNEVLLVDLQLGTDSSGNNYKGTDLIAEQALRRNIYLCTNDFDDLDAIKQARELGIKILPKPLCFTSQLVQNKIF